MAKRQQTGANTWTAPPDSDRPDEHPSGMLPAPGRPLEERHLEAGVRFAAYVVVRYGDVYAPTFERLERELVEMRRRRSPADRARMLLEASSSGVSLAGALLPERKEPSS